MVGLVFHTTLEPTFFELKPNMMYFKGDKYKLSGLFANLLENAIKYDKSGGNIKVKLEKR